MGNLGKVEEEPRDVYVGDVIGERITIDTGSAAMLIGAVLEQDEKGPYVEYGGVRIDIEDGKEARLCRGKPFEVEFDELRYCGERIRIKYSK